MFNLSDGSILEERELEKLDSYDFLLRLYLKQVKVLKELEGYKN